MSDLISRIQKQFRKRGLKGVLRGAIRFLLRPAYAREEVVMFRKPLRADYRTVPLPPSLRKRAFAFTWGSAADVGRIGFIDDRWKACIRAYLAEGSEICLCEFDGEILSYLLSHGRHILDTPRGLRLPLGSGEVYQFDGQVAPEFRGKGLAQHHMNHFETEMMRRGFHDVISIVESGNQSATRFHERNGFRAARRGAYVRLGPFQDWRWGAAIPAVGAEAVGAAP